MIQRLVLRGLALAPWVVVATQSALPAAAQATALVREGDVLPETPAGHDVRFLRGFSVNALGGWAVRVETDDGSMVFPDFVWGAPTAEAAARLMRAEQTFGIVRQIGLQTPLLDDQGRLIYRTRLAEPGLFGVHQAVYRDDDLLMRQETQHPTLAQRIWGLPDFPLVATADGRPAQVSRLKTPIGDDIDRGLFFGDGWEPLIHVGDAVPPLDLTVEPCGDDFVCAVSSMFDVSRSGDHWITTFHSGGEHYLAVDGEIPMLDGVPVGTADPIPALGGGGDGEHWLAFGAPAISDAGNYVFAATIGSPTCSGCPEQQVLARDGVIWRRPGDVVDGRTIEAVSELLDMDDQGRVLHWATVNAGLTTKSVLFLEDRAVLEQGEEVDWNGDDVADADEELLSLDTAVELGPGPTAYFTATVSHLDGSASRALMRLRLTTASAVVANGTGVNRLCFTSAGPPVVGQPWMVTVDTTGHTGATLSGLVIRTDLLTPGLPFMGNELLLDPASPRILRLFAPTSGGVDGFTLLIPPNASLVGVTAAAQGVILGGGIELCNALDLVIGR